MLIYHRTYASQAILSEGFKDGEGTYMTRQFHRGVWFSNYPLDANEGAFGNAVLVLDIPKEIFEQYEWVEEGKVYRESLIPAEVINSFGVPRLCTEEEIDTLMEQVTSMSEIVTENDEPLSSSTSAKGRGKGGEG